METQPTYGGADLPALTVTIHLGNDACQDADDALQVLERTVRDINTGRDRAVYHDPNRMTWAVRDENGNRVGTVEVTQ